MADQLRNNVINGDCVIVETEHLPQPQPEEGFGFDVYEVIGNPYKSTLCFPTCAELRRLNWKALIFGFVWWFVCFYINCVMQVTTENIENRTYPVSQGSEHFVRHRYWSESYEIFDLGFYAFPRVPDIYSDIIAYGFAFGSVLRFVLIKNRFVVIKRYVLLLGSVFLLRSITIIVTILPPPQMTCNGSANGNPFIDAFWILMVQKKTCTDVFFSGHVTNITFGAMLWWEFSHRYPIIPLTCLDKFLFRGKPLLNNYGSLKRPTLTKIVMWIVATVGYYLVCATRLHFMIDVMFGIIIPVMAFKLYNQAMVNAYFNNSLISQFIRWFESDSPEMVIYKRVADMYPFLHVDSKMGRVRKNSISVEDVRNDSPEIIESNL